MTCPKWHEFNMRDFDEMDASFARHIVSCPSCRREVDARRALLRALEAMPEVDTPPQFAASFSALATQFADRQLSCGDAQDYLEAWREGALDGDTAFLMDDHLLWCPECNRALAHAQALTTLLREMPALTPPAAIAERIAAARVPWWQRWFSMPMPQWTRPLAASAGLAAVLLTLFIGGPQSQTFVNLASRDPLPKTNLIPVIPVPPGPLTVALPPDMPNPVRVNRRHVRVPSPPKAITVVTQLGGPSHVALPPDVKQGSFVEKPGGSTSTNGGDIVVTVIPEATDYSGKRAVEMSALANDRRADEEYLSSVPNDFMLPAGEGAGIPDINRMSPMGN